jgi:predicted XRE-type DNA-binding protein
MPRIKARDLHEKAMREDPSTDANMKHSKRNFPSSPQCWTPAEGRLDQAQVAERMGVKQPVVAKIEGGRSNVPSTT